MHEQRAERPAPGLAVRVLLVDDDKSIRQLLATVLAEEGIHVIGEAANGWEGLALTRLLQPDVVLMDLHMPLMNGIEATRRIRAEHPTVRVIGLSSMADEDEQAIAMREAGAVSYLLKNASPDVLVAAIRGGQEKEKFLDQAQTMNPGKISGLG